jgi:dipeptidyl-peptidase-4
MEETMKRLTLTLLLSISLVYAGNGNLKKLTSEQVIHNKGEKLYTPLPDIRGWADDTHYYQFKEEKLFKVNAKNGKSSLVFNSKENKDLGKNGFIPYRAADETNDYNKFLFIKDGTIFLFLRQKNELQSLFNIPEARGEIKNPKLSPDGTQIAYTLKGNLFVFDIPTKKEIQVTADGSEDILNGYASWVYYEEILGRRSRYRAFWWSPDSSRIAFMRFDQAKVPVFSIYSASGDYGNLEHMRYPKAGFPNPTVKIGIAHLETNQVQWIDFKDADEHYLAFPVWNKTGDKFFFQWMNRGQDHLKILCYDLESNKLQPVYEEKQKAWVEFFEGDDFYVLKNNDVLIRSSKDGWYHIYYLPWQGRQRQVTKGSWSVTRINGVDEKRRLIYFSARKEDSTETDFYRIDFFGKKTKRLTDFKGTHSVELSPGCRYLIDRYSSIHTPTKIDVRDTRGRLVRKVADSYSPLLNKYRLAKVELFRIKTEDGFELPAVWYLPPDFDKSKKYPVVMTIYGGPGSSIVTNSYGRGYRGGLEKFFLAQEGIINLFVDNRGSGHFGKKGMDLMHRQLGKWEMFDFIQVATYLRTLAFVDDERIGIKGHSYGGYVAALALTYGADYFQYGISGSPVIDWRLYDSVYSERYMDTPRENPEGYDKSSSLTYVGKYKGMLRITHGTLDDNVHAQNTLQFIDKVLNTGKTLELMLYPGNRHGIRDKKSIEYRKSDINFWLKHFFGRTIK